MSYSGHEIKTDVIVLYQDRYHVIEVQVVEGDVMAVAGLKAATELNLVHPPTRVPYMLRDKVKAELDRMERMGIITKVEQPTKG